MEPTAENQAETPVQASGEVFTKIAQLYPTISLWEVSISRTKEQETNANVMDAASFDLLTKTIQEEKALESLPFGVIDYTDPNRPVFAVISGHHRKRAAAAAGETRIFVLVSDKPLSADEVVQKQLAHNAISGSDDPQVLKRLYERIQSTSARIRTGINPDDLAKSTLRPVQADSLQFEFGHKTVKLLFLNSQLEKLDRVAASISPDDVVLVCDMRQLDDFTAKLRKLSQVEGIRNGAALMAKMLELTEAYCKNQLNAVGGEITSSAPETTRKPIGFGARGAS